MDSIGQPSHGRSQPPAGRREELLDAHGVRGSACVRGGELGVVPNELSTGRIETGVKVGHRVDRLLGLEQEAPDVAAARRVALGAAGARVAAVTPLTRSSMLARSVVGPVSGPSSAEGAPTAPAIRTTASVAAGEVAAQVPATTGASPTPMHEAARTSWSNEVTVRPVRPSAAPASSASRGAATMAMAPSRDEIVGRLHGRDGVVRRREDHDCAGERSPGQVELVGRAVEDAHARGHDSGSDLDTRRAALHEHDRPTAVGGKGRGEQRAARDHQARTVGKSRAEPSRAVLGGEVSDRTGAGPQRGWQLGGRHGPRLPGTSRRLYAALSRVFAPVRLQQGATWVSQATARC